MSKQLVIKIDNCEDCPNSFFTDTDERIIDGWVCLARDDKKIPNTERIPDWCPLDDYEQRTKEKED